jgi:hypothetical protein
MHHTLVSTASNAFNGRYMSCPLRLHGRDAPVAAGTCSRTRTHSTVFTTAVRAATGHRPLGFTNIISRGERQEQGTALPDGSGCKVQRRVNQSAWFSTDAGLTLSNCAPALHPLPQLERSHRSQQHDQVVRVVSGVGLGWKREPAARSVTLHCCRFKFELAAHLRDSPVMEYASRVCHAQGQLPASRTHPPPQCGTCGYR